MFDSEDRLVAQQQTEQQTEQQEQQTECVFEVTFRGKTWAGHCLGRIVRRLNATIPEQSDKLNKRCIADLVKHRYARPYHKGSTARTLPRSGYVLPDNGEWIP